jgi:hypothetical protein
MINLLNTTGVKSKNDKIGQRFMILIPGYLKHNASLLVFRKKTTTPQLLQDKSCHVPS